MISKASILFYFLLAFVILVSVGGYFLFIQRQDLFVKHMPSLYWKIQKEEKEVDLPQVSGRVIKKEDNDTLVINSAKGKRVEFLIPSLLQVLRIDPKMKREKIEFEEIKEEEYVLVILSPDTFYENEKTAGSILVSDSPVFSKVEKYEKD